MACYCCYFVSIVCVFHKFCEYTFCDVVLLFFRFGGEGRLGREREIHAERETERQRQRETQTDGATARSMERERE